MNEIEEKYREMIYDQLYQKLGDNVPENFPEGFEMESKEAFFDYAISHKDIFVLNDLLLTYGNKDIKKYIKKYPLNTLFDLFILAKRDGYNQVVKFLENIPSILNARRGYIDKSASKYNKLIIDPMENIISFLGKHNPKSKKSCKKRHMKWVKSKKRKSYCRRSIKK